MKRKDLLKLIGILLLIPIMAYVYTLSTPNKMRFEYLGKSFAVDKDKPRYSEKQIAKIQELIKNEKLPERFDTFSDFVDYQSKLQPRGYGSGSGGAQTDFGFLSYFAFQIPGDEDFKVMVYIMPNNKEYLLLFDDFYWPGRPPFNKFKNSNDTIQFTDFTYTEVYKSKKIDTLIFK